MKYYIQRGVNEYGPYTLADLQRYVAQGNIALSDLTRSEGMTEWVPVSQVIGDIPIPAPTPVAQAGGTVYAGTTPYGVAPASAVGGPTPVDFHWGLVLLITVLLCNLFRVVWLFVEASFVNKIKPGSGFLPYLIVGKSLEFLAVIIFYTGVGISAANNSSEPPLVAFAVSGLVWFIGVTILYVGIFKMKAAMEAYYNSVEPINLRLNGAMTFFFPAFYFQHHLSRVAQWKKTGYLVPQQ